MGQGASGQVAVGTAMAIGLELQTPCPWASSLQICLCTTQDKQNSAYGLSQAQQMIKWWGTESILESVKIKLLWYESKYENAVRKGNRILVQIDRV